MQDCDERIGQGAGSEEVLALSKVGASREILNSAEFPCPPEQLRIDLGYGVEELSICEERIDRAIRVVQGQLFGLLEHYLAFSCLIRPIVFRPQKAGPLALLLCL